MSNRKIRAILADDHALVVEGLRGMIEQEGDIEVVATAYDGDELIELLEVHDVDVVVLDVEMPTCNGLKALKVIRERGFNVSILVLTAFSDGDTLQSALELEAEGIALKTESPKQTINAIRQVAEGNLVFPRAAQRLLMRRQDPAEKEELSARETEVVALVADGLTNPEISDQLNVSENTVRFHLKNIFEKLDVTNRTEAAGWYIKRNLNG